MCVSSACVNESVCVFLKMALGSKAKLMSSLLNVPVWDSFYHTCAKAVKIKLKFVSRKRERDSRQQ